MTTTIIMPLNICYYFRSLAIFNETVIFWIRLLQRVPKGIQPHLKRYHQEFSIYARFDGNHIYKMWIFVKFILQKATVRNKNSTKPLARWFSWFLS